MINQRIVLLIFIISFCSLGCVVDSLAINNTVENAYDSSDYRLIEEIQLQGNIDSLYEQLTISNKLKYCLLNYQLSINKKDYKQALFNLEKSELLINQIKDKALERQLRDLEELYETDKKKKRNHDLRNYSIMLKKVFKKRRIISCIIMSIVCLGFLISLIKLSIILIQVYTSKELKDQKNRSQKRLNNLIDQIDQMKEQYLLNSQKEPMTLSIRKSEEVSTLSQDQKENIAMFVHDFKNPLAIMKSTVQFYEDSFPADSEGMEISQNIKRNIDEITESIQLFLEFSKAGIDAPRDSGLISLINNALKSVERSAAEITKEFPKEDIIIKVDSLLFENIITQILRNSLESSENPISIVVELTQSRKFVNIIISDNGDGIPETIKDTIMDPFVSTKPYHLGLGLTLAKYYLAEIRGQVSILKSDSDGTKLMIQILK